ncbi:hypothetical protein [Marinivivus vitaminiproducens]|uniref:hypothetical protein n=1 Tax=Marinivivus vitaminiproducens TaxID=3035935 RepID=UPI0027A324B7|nr:hypothetical protein P4R82_08240 [Geminicoccaceae bacterium SCSIO 64248]
MTPRPEPLPPSCRVPGYRFAPRRSRRRVAQILAAGHDPVRAARIERVAAGEVAALLGDESFGLLVAHYRDLAALPRAARIDRLADLALEILELGLEAGDLKLAMFVLHERARGRDPSRSVALRVVERLDALAARAVLPPEEGQPEDGSPEDPAPVGPPRTTGGRRSRTDRERHAPGADLAGFQADDGAASARALDLLQGTVPALAGRTFSALASRLTGEAERLATGSAAGAAARAEDEAVRAARHLRAACPPAVATAADLRLHVRQEAAAFGRRDALPMPVAGAAYFESLERAARNPARASTADGPSAGHGRAATADRDEPTEPEPVRGEPDLDDDPVKAAILAIAPAPPAREPPGPERSPWRRAGRTKAPPPPADDIDALLRDAAGFLLRERRRTRPP